MTYFCSHSLLHGDRPNLDHALCCLQAETVVTQGAPDTSGLEARAAVSVGVLMRTEAARVWAELGQMMRWGAASLSCCW